MYPTHFVYPHVERGYQIEFAPTEDTPDAHWTLGQIVRTKNGAVDVQILNPADRTVQFKVDVRHIGDPGIQKRPLRSDSGVFRLAKSQLQINQLLADNQAIMRRMDALEQTFRAVMETSRAESMEMPPVPMPSRRAGRTTASV